MDYINELYALQVGAAGGVSPAAATTAANTTSEVDFASLLAAITDETGAASAAGLEEELMSQISERVQDAPNFLYSFHPSVYQKMAEDPEFLREMVNTVDAWTSSAMFTQAKSSSDIFSTLLAGQDGSTATAAARMAGLGGSSSILDFAVSNELLASQSGMEAFLSQFDGLPEEVRALLVQGAEELGADSNAQYQAMAAAAEVQKRMLLD